MISEEAASNNPFWRAYYQNMLTDVFTAVVRLKTVALKAGYAKLSQAELEALMAAADTCQNALAELTEVLKMKVLEGFTGKHEGQG